jgi:hypothetical protein
VIEFTFIRNIHIFYLLNKNFRVKVISLRVSSCVRGYGISWCDFIGNCYRKYCTMPELF